MISKKEQIWRYILEKALIKKRVLEFEQQRIAQELKVSTSTVFNALKIPRQSGAVRVGGRKFRLADVNKLLAIWSTQRNISRDIIYQTYIDASAQDLESSMPPGVIFGCYTAYRLRFQEAPADYDKVYVYSRPDIVEELRKRFPASKKSESNIMVLEADVLLEQFGEITPNSQLYADLWNLSDWYAHDFLEGLKQKLNI